MEVVLTELQVVKLSRFQIVGEVPLPTSREVALAGTTAMAATATALIGKSLVEWMIKRLKPIVKKGLPQN